MKRLAAISFLFVLIFASNTKAQPYHKFIDSTLYWDVAYADMWYICGGYSDFPPQRYTLAGDTMINDIRYKKFISYSMYPIYHDPPPMCPPFYIDTIPGDMIDHFMREDTINHKVYMYDTYEEIERLWYDFDAQIGDTISYPGYGDFIVDTVYDIITNDGKTRKYFECNYGWDGYYIEGLGGTGGPFYEPFEYFEAGTWLMCVKNHDGQPIWGTNCYDFTTSVPDLNPASQGKVYPNPAGNHLFVELTVIPAEISIYNNQGMEVIATTVTEKTSSIDLSQIDNGIYYLVIIEEGGNIYSRKIMKIK